MPQVMTIHEAVTQAKRDGINISEYSLRRWIKTGDVPARKAGRKTLVYYPNVIAYITCVPTSQI